MLDIADGLAAWQAAGIRFCVATVVRTWKSAPRQPGAAMAVSETGEVLGSVSGGCVEGAIYDLCREVLATGQSVVKTYGVSENDAFEVGLTCGGVIEVLVQRADLVQIPEVLAAIRGGRPVAVASVIDGPHAVGGYFVVEPSGSSGTLGNPGLDWGLLEQARGLLAKGRTGTVHIGLRGEQRNDDLTIFVQSFAPPPHMLVFGATDFASAVARIGKFLGYHVTVCDARPIFATRKRFPDVDELVVMWPHRYLDQVVVDEQTVICVLTHDPKFDVPLLERALLTPARYIGAMGSRRTHADRVDRLREIGVTEESIARISSPIGLDLGARTPEETAVAIAAEIVALTWSGSSARLTDGALAIHR